MRTREAGTEQPSAGARMFSKRSVRKPQRRHNPKKVKRWVPRAAWFSDNRNEGRAER